MQVITYYIHEGIYVVKDYCSLFTVDFHEFVVLFFLESSFPVIVQSSVLISEFLIINTIS